MERLTYKDASNNWVIACTSFWHWFENKLPAHIKGEAVDRLADYENLFEKWGMQNSNFEELNVWKHLNDSLSSMALRYTEYESEIQKLCGMDIEEILKGLKNGVKFRYIEGNINLNLCCKNCKYMKYAEVNKKGFLICPASGMEITDNDFCSYFESEGT